MSVVPFIPLPLQLVFCCGIQGRRSTYNGSEEHSTLSYIGLNPGAGFKVRVSFGIPLTTCPQASIIVGGGIVKVVFIVSQYTGQFGTVKSKI